MTTLTFLGAARTVTGSRFLVETDAGARLLVDCGLYQGRKNLRLRNWDAFPVAPDSIDAVVLSHAHVDHCGYLPALVRDGFRGDVVCTPATAALASIVLPDSGRLHEEEAAYANRHGTSKHSPALPLYTEADADAALQQLRTLDFGVSHDVTGATVRLQPAGHILGSSIVSVAVDGCNLTFSGDLGRPIHPLLRPPSPPPDSDVIVVESTYGTREHDEEVSHARFGAAVGRTLGRGGVVVIPAFAVDRTEVVLHMLASLMADGSVPEATVYVDSPMALRALRVYREFMRAGSEDLRENLWRDDFALEPRRVREVRTVEESKALNEVDGPAVIISASGMATGGRVLHHLIHRLGNERNSVVLVGYQAMGTRGRRLLDGEKEIKIFGNWFRVRAEVAECTGMSVHADASELLDWIAAAPASPSAIYVVHGEEDAATSLAGVVGERMGLEALAPRLGERVEVTRRRAAPPRAS